MYIDLTIEIMIWCTDRTYRTGIRATESKRDSKTLIEDGAGQQYEKKTRRVDQRRYPSAPESMISRAPRKSGTQPHENWTDWASVWATALATPPAFNCPIWV